MENDAFDAVREGKLKKLESLIKSGCDVNAQDEEGVTLLILAASLGHKKIVQLLVDAGADVNQVNENAQTVDEHNPLAAAASKNNKDIIDYLKPKTKPKLRKKSFKNALFQAIDEGNIEAIQTLINTYEVDVNIHRPGVWSKNGWSILMDAAEAGQTALVKILLEAGADPNYADGDEGKTPIMCGIASKKSELVHSLIEAGANVNTPNASGKTPLMRAAELGSSQIVEMLIQAGADVNAIDNATMSVVWYAEKMGNLELVSIIRGTT